MAFNWIVDTMNRNRRSGSNWLHDIGPEEVQKGFFSIIRDMESFHFDMNHFNSVIMDEVFINESYSAAYQKSTELFYKRWALSFLKERILHGEPDPFLLIHEIELIEYDYETYAAWTHGIDAYRINRDPNMIIFAIDEIQTIGKKKKLIRDKVELEEKPKNCLWSQYKEISPAYVDRFIRSIGKGKVSVTDIMTEIFKNISILPKAYTMCQKRYALYSAIEAGYRKILDSNPQNPDKWIWGSYPVIKRSLTAYDIMVNRLYQLMGLDPNSPVFKSTLIALKSLLLKDYNGAL